MFDLQTDIFLGGRIDQSFDRHFHGRIALFRVYGGDVGSQEARCIFREGDAVLSHVMETQNMFSQDQPICIVIDGSPDASLGLRLTIELAHVQLSSCEVLRAPPGPD